MIKRFLLTSDDIDQVVIDTLGVDDTLQLMCYSALIANKAILKAMEQK